MALLRCFTRWRGIPVTFDYSRVELGEDVSDRTRWYPLGVVCPRYADQASVVPDGPASRYAVGSRLEQGLIDTTYCYGYFQLREHEVSLAERVNVGVLRGELRTEDAVRRGSGDS